MIVPDKYLYPFFRYGVSVGKYPVRNAQIKRLRNGKWNVSRYIGVSFAEGKDILFEIFYVIFVIVVILYITYV